MPRLLALPIFFALLMPFQAAFGAEPPHDPCAAAAAEHPPKSAVRTRGTNMPFALGLLWKIERPGVAPSYVYGTIHLDVRWVTQLPPRVNLLFAHSRSLVTEVELGTAANNLYRRRMLLPAGESLKRMLRQALYARYMKIAVDYYRLDAKTAAHLKPWAATNLLARPRPTTGVVLDDALQRRARSVGKPVHALQTMSELIDELEAMPKADQIKVLDNTICNHSRLMKQVPKLLQIYRSQDLRALAALNRQGPHDDEALFRRMMKHMLYDRNVLMVKRMQPYLKQGKAFVAVGSLHLPGRRGILALLEKQGYSVTRVPFVL